MRRRELIALITLIIIGVIGVPVAVFYGYQVGDTFGGKPVAIVGAVLGYVILHIATGLVVFNIELWLNSQVVLEEIKKGWIVTIIIYALLGITQLLPMAFPDTNRTRINKKREEEKDVRKKGTCFL